MMQQSAQPIKGAKSGGSGSQTPYTAPDTLRSVATAKLLYAISEGEIEGLVNGYNSVYLDGTPVNNADGSANIEGVTVDFRAGTVDQSYIQGFPETNNEVSVGVELRYGTPWVRQFTNPQLSAVRLRFAWPSLLTQKDNGDRVGYRITYAIDVSTDGGSYTTVLTTAVDGKTESEYERSHRIDLPQQGSSWQIRVRRLTENADSVTTGDTMNVVSYTEVVDAKLRYPHTALLAVQYNSEQFSSVPKFAALCRGRIIQVPTNYDPETRTYATSGTGTTNGVWDGTFKLAYTNNPAWVWYDLILHKRYGLGNRINANMVNKWKLYQISQYCDVMVDDGKGGTEPRYTCNVYIQTQSQAYQLLNELTSIFHGKSYWDGSQMVVNADMPEDPIYTYTNANVIDGIFEYKGTALRDRHSVATTKWSNPDLNYEDDTAVVFDDSAVTLGISQLDVDVVGCTSEGQAQRAGLWALKSEQLETRTVNFTVGLDGQIPRPFNIINIADQMLQGAMNGGRIKTATASVVQLDRIADAAVGDRLIVNLPSGKAESRNITDIDGYHVTVSPNYSEVPQSQSVWVVDSDNLAVMQFRVLSIKRSDEKKQYEINAVISVPGKHSAIDSGAKIDVKPISVIPAKIQEPPTNVTLSQRTLVEQTLSVTVMTIQWDAADGAVAYDVEWRKDNGDWIKVPRTGTRSVEVRGVYTGQYLARVTAINAADISSKYATSALTDITGKTGSPPALASLTTSSIVFGIDLNWSFPAGSEDTLYTEIYYATSGSGANETLLGQYAYPLDNHTLNGLAAGVSFWFKARIVDRTGNIGPWTDYVQGSSSSDSGVILDYLTGKITESELAQDLLQPIQSIPTLTANIDSINQQLAEITGAGAWVNTTVYDSGDYVTYDDGTGVSLYRAKQDAIPAGTLPTNTTYWDYVGDYASIGEAVAALTASVTDIENSIDVLDGQLTANVRRTDTMIAAYRDDDDGEGRLADVLAGWKAKAAIKLEQKTRASEIEAEAQQRLNLTATVNSNYSDITQQLTVLSNDQQSTAQDLETLQTDYESNKSSVQNTLDSITTETGALAQSIQQVEASASAANAAASTAQNAADQAKADAAAAAGIANGKGKVIIQSTEPATADRLAQNLWIDTTGGANTPKRWNGSAWVAVTDKAATDAANAAAAAQSTADAAQSASAQNTAAVQQVSQAQADLEGNVNALVTIKAETTTSGRKVWAGLALGSNGESSEILLKADNISFINGTDENSITPAVVIENGMPMMNAALIGILLNKTIIQRVGTSMQVFGIGFGSSGQFVEWFGPNVGDISNCTEANATSYKKTNGDQFTGGSFRSGVLQNGYQNTGISAYAVGDYPVSFGPFGTNGRSKTVLLSISAAGPVVQLGTHLDGWSPGTLPTPVFGWAIERKIGSGSWTQIAAGTITGSTVVYQDEIPDTNQYNYYSTSSIDGSYTYTDNSVSTDNFSYRVRVTAWTSVYSGSNPAARQSIGLTSIES
ncbi:TipJ family phage tail tip protein [Shewanella fodinae]|uniref:TipJ family phage tail tip protein n=1 Tax=Shewanella fodinae TaxID=552357 RepID=UPI00167647BF|nr:phage tail protein [Shewanella fodinae]MCL2905240.1 phage tail protein [Shewanella fodinae]GGY87556.1 lambda phage tail fiber protein J [Shewanella fodinae]